MSGPAPSWTTFARAVLVRLRETEATFLAAAVAYYAFVSLLPLLVLILVVGTTVGGETVARAVVERAAGLLSPAGQSVVQDALTAHGGRSEVSVLGTVLLVWGALKVVRGLGRAVDRVYGSTAERTLLDSMSEAALTLGIGGVAGAATVGVVSIIRLITGPVSVVATLGLHVVLFVTFVPLYVRLPSGEVTVRESVPGAIVAAVGWGLLGTIFGLYTAVVGTSVYGILGAVLLIVTWLYLGALILVLGAAVNAVLAGGSFEET